MGELPFKSIHRSVITKRKEDTSERFGCRPESREIKDHLDYGVVNIDKPKGPSSHQVSSYVQKILGITKAGHSGTLDPGVTGALPIALSKATKVANALLLAGKEYAGVMHFHKDISEADIRKACSKFTGEITQLPPLKSAIKRKERKRTVYYLDILEIEGRDALFMTGVEAGTYIRKLVHDIGQKAGAGANMAELRRTKSGPFDESTLVTLQHLSDAFWLWKEKGDESVLREVVQPMEKAVNHLPKVWVMDTTVDSICHGAQLKLPGIAKLHADIEKGRTIAIMTLKDELIALATAAMDSRAMKKKDKGISAKLERVFMQPGTYPRVEK